MKTNVTHKSLVTLRNEIDKLDQKLIKLLAARMDIVVQVGQWKQKHNVVPLDQSRWQEVIDSRKLIARQNNLDQNLVEEIFELIHQQALLIERQK
jgi:chorismate mutase